MCEKWNIKKLKLANSTHNVNLAGHEAPCLVFRATINSEMTLSLDTYKFIGQGDENGPFFDKCPMNNYLTSSF